MEEKDDLIALYYKMLLIRRFEEKTGQMYAMGKIGGFCHLYIGQEAVAVGAITVLRPDDYVVSAYRDHGHCIIKGSDPKRVMAELYGKVTGVSKGKGGSMHMFDVENNFMGGDAIVGGDLPLAIGLGFAINYLQKDQVVMCFFGDGSVNIGGFHEALNMAALWRLPVIFVCENNVYGMGTRVEKASAVPELERRVCAYNMESELMDGMDVLEVREVCKRVVARTREDKHPRFIEAKTYRYRGHSVADPAKYRGKEEVERWKERDPILLLGRKLKAEGILTPEGFEEIENKVNHEVEEAVEFAEKSPLLPSEAICDDVFVIDNRYIKWQ